VTSPPTTSAPAGLALVVDDSRSMRSILGRLLGSLGWTTCEAGDGHEALELLADGCRPALVLVDWNMPVMNGLDFVTAVRADPRTRDLTVVMVSSESEREQIVLAVDAGADEYIVKPFTADALAEKIALVTGSPAGRL
jgi:two-component system, chemotaxis family, chemotaxis protein CheY